MWDIIFGIIRNKDVIFIYVKVIVVCFGKCSF